MADDRYEKLAGGLNSTAIQLLKRVRETDRALGLSGPRMSALAVLAFRGRQTLAALAQAEQVAAPTMSRLVDALEHEGLAIREPNPADRRSILVSATPKGKRLLQRGQRERTQRLAGDLQRLPEDSIELLEQAVATLEQLGNHHGG